MTAPQPALHVDIEWATGRNAETLLADLAKAGLTIIKKAEVAAVKEGLKQAGDAYAALDRVRALIPTTDPELIDAGYAVPATDLLAAIDGPQDEDGAR